MASSPAALTEPASGGAALSAIPKAAPRHFEAPAVEANTAANLDPQPSRSFQIMSLSSH